jgi:hypothetical protein
MARLTASEKIDQLKDDAEFKRFLVLFLTEVKLAVNGNLNFVDNFGAREVSVTFSAANTDTRVDTGLKNVPTKYIVQGTTAAMSIYDGTLSPQPGVIFLRSSAVGTARLLVL